MQPTAAVRPEGLEPSFSLSGRTRHAFSWLTTLTSLLGDRHDTLGGRRSSPYLG